MIAPVKDSAKTHWVNRAPLTVRPYLQLSRLDRPVGYWLLALPGWIGLAFAGLSVGYVRQDLIWALLILIGAIAMRGAGCTYNDIVDQDLDAQVERTALRPLPAGSVSTKQAWIWLLAQCAIGLIVLLCLPRLAQIIALCSIPLVAAYPYMKRITWWPQLWLGLTFNWAVLVAYAAKTGTLSPAVLILYAGLIFWTVGYDTIYACQDIEDDAMIGVKSTARRFGKRVKHYVWLLYLISVILIGVSILNEGSLSEFSCGTFISAQLHFGEIPRLKGVIWALVIILPPGLFTLHLLFWQFVRLFYNDEPDTKYLTMFKSNFWAGIFLVTHISLFAHLGRNTHSEEHICFAASQSSNPQKIFDEYCQKPVSSRLCYLRPLTPS